ncbi:hypothetical protein EFN45_09095, partial [Leuconostoc citreum]|nr:hypothetical protein [Leuconostoc citreum]
PIIRLVKPPAGHAVTGQFIIAGSPSVRACHAERYPRGASWCQLNHIKNKLRQYLYLSQLILNTNIITYRINLNLKCCLSN